MKNCGICARDCPSSHHCEESETLLNHESNGLRNSRISPIKKQFNDGHNSNIDININSSQKTKAMELQLQLQRERRYGYRKCHYKHEWDHSLKYNANNRKKSEPVRNNQNQTLHYQAGQFFHAKRKDWLLSKLQPTTSKSKGMPGGENKGSHYGGKMGGSSASNSDSAGHAHNFNPNTPAPMQATQAANNVTLTDAFTPSEENAPAPDDPSYIRQSGGQGQCQGQGGQKTRDAGLNNSSSSSSVSTVTEGTGTGTSNSSVSCSPQGRSRSEADRRKRRRSRRKVSHYQKNGSSHGGHNGHLPNGNGRSRHTSTADSEENESELSLEREAPDGGWGWVVVFAAFFINLIADGVTFSFGSFLPSIQKEFDASKGATAWVGSLLASMPLLSGPIASTLTDRYGCRKVTIVGAILATFGFYFSYYAEDIHTLMFTFGIVTGFGLSLCYVAAVVIVAYYFERKRSLATGLSVCGGGIGTFIFAPLNSLLIEAYGWRMTLIIVAGCFFSLVICGLLMKDLEWTKKSSKKRERVLQNEAEFNTQAQLNIIAASPTLLLTPALSKQDRLCNSALCLPTFVSEEERGQYQKSNRIRYYSNTLAEPSSDLKLNQLDLDLDLNPRPRPRSDPKDEEDSDEDEDEAFHDQDFNSKTRIVRNQDNQRNAMKMKAKAPSSSLGVVIDIENETGKSNNLNLVKKNNAKNKNLALTLQIPEKKDKQETVKEYVITQRRFCKDFGNHRNSLTYRGAVLNLKRSYRLRPASSCPDIISVATTDEKNLPAWKAVLLDLYDWTKEMFAWDNLRNIKFLMFVISNFLLYMWYDIPLTFLTDTATDLGYTEKEGAFLGATIGITTVFGNIILGYIGDKRWANSVTIYGVCISICGIVTALMPTFFVRTDTNYYYLCCLCGVFGLMIAANYSLTPVILLQVVSLDRFANAYGLLLLVQGIGNLIGPPIAGGLYDVLGTYSVSFWVTGGGIFISNWFLFVPLYKSYFGKPKNEPILQEKGGEGNGNVIHA